MKKAAKFVVFLLTSVLLVFVFALAGCSTEEPRYIRSVAVVGDSLVAYYSDGSNETIANVNTRYTIEELYEECKKVYGEDLTYEEFLEKYVTVDVPVDNSKVIGQALTSSVKFFTEFSETVSTGIMQSSKRTGLYTGSGVIYKKDTEYTYMITNYHVVYSQYANSDNDNGHIAEAIHCYLYGSESAPYKSGSNGSYTVYEYDSYAVPCEYVGGSLANDIAVVRAKTSDMLAINANYTAAEFADSYHVGQTAIAIGNPEGEGISVSEGIVSVADEYINLNIDGKGARQYRSMRIDTAIYSGNSGGGLFNTSGKLIGITNAGDGEDQSINYAVPLEIAKGVADNILWQYGDGSEGAVSVQVPKLGVNVTSENARYSYDANSGYGEIVENIVVKSIVENSIAQKIGLQSGDILKGMTVGDVTYTLNRNFDISDILLTARPDATLTVTYLRGGEIKTTSAYTFRQSDFAAVE